MRKLIAALLGALTAALAGPVQGLAWVDWCEDEPPVTVVTPAGHHVTVNNFLSAPRQDRHLLHKAVVTGEAVSDGPGQSLIRVWVWLPRGGSQYVKATSRTQRYEQEVHGDGRWGEVIELDLTVPID